MASAQAKFIMKFTNLLGSKRFDPLTYERDLSKISEEIVSCRDAVEASKRLKVSSSRSIQIYGYLCYIIWVYIRYRYAYSALGILANGRNKLWIMFNGQLLRESELMLVIPLLIFGCLFALSRVLQMHVNSRQKRLNNLTKKHKNMIEGLKEATHFSKTQQLLNQYDKVDQLPAAGHNLKASNKEVKPVESGSPRLKLVSHESRSFPEPRYKTDASQTLFSRPVLNPTGRITLQERFLDLIIGSDHNESVENRFALICSLCYTHNGLAPPGSKSVENLRYRCRACGHLNGIVGEVTSPSSSAVQGEPEEKEKSGNEAATTEEQGKSVNEAIDKS